MSRSRMLHLGSLMAAMVASSAQAQEPAYSLTPSAGVFLAAAELAGDESVQSLRTGGLETVTIRHQVGPTLGLRATRRMGMRLALEAEALLALSDIELTSEDAGVATVTQNARVFVLAIDLRYDVYRVPFSPFSTHVLGGVGLVARGGEFFDEGAGVLEDAEAGTDLAGLIGAGFRYGLDPVVTLRVDIRDVISSYQQKFAEVELDSNVQHDLWVTLGLEFGL